MATRKRKKDQEAPPPKESATSKKESVQASPSAPAVNLDDGQNQKTEEPPPAEEVEKQSSRFTEEETRILLNIRQHPIGVAAPAVLAACAIPASEGYQILNKLMAENIIARASGRAAILWRLTTHGALEMGKVGL